MIIFLGFIPSNLHIPSYIIFSTDLQQSHGMEDKLHSIVDG